LRRRNFGQKKWREKKKMAARARIFFLSFSVSENWRKDDSPAVERGGHRAPGEPNPARGEPTIAVHSELLEIDLYLKNLTLK
jgi:hypothetical protein